MNKKAVLVIASAFIALATLMLLCPETYCTTYVVEGNQTVDEGTYFTLTGVTDLTGDFVGLGWICDVWTVVKGEIVYSALYENPLQYAFSDDGEYQVTLGVTAFNWATLTAPTGVEDVGVFTYPHNDEVCGVKGYSVLEEEITGLLDYPHNSEKCGLDGFSVPYVVPSGMGIKLYFIHYHFTYRHYHYQYTTVPFPGPVVNEYQTVTVTVRNVAPTVEAGPDQTADVDETVTIYAQFFDPGWSDTETPICDFGDGTPTSKGFIEYPSNATFMHIYKKPGVYTVTVSVTDDDGGTGTDSLTVVVGASNVIPEVPIGPIFSLTPMLIGLAVGLLIAGSLIALVSSLKGKRKVQLAG